jgi:hypothetical protein
VQPSGDSLTKYVALLWVEVGQPALEHSENFTEAPPGHLAHIVYLFVLRVISGRGLTAIVSLNSINSVALLTDKKLLYDEYGTEFVYII